MYFKKCSTMTLFVETHGRASQLMVYKKTELLFSHQLSDPYNHIHCFLHRQYRYILVRTMKIMPSGENIGAWQAFPRKLCPIGSATNSFYLGCYAHIFHRLLSQVNNV